MKRKESSLMSILLIILCFNSIIYYEIQEVDLSNNNPVNEIVPQDDSILDSDYYLEDDSFLIKKDLIPGDFQTFAFFSGGGTEAGNDLIDEPEYPYEADNNDTSYYPNVIEWVTYNEIKDGGHIPKELHWRSLSTDPITWPSSAGEWHHLRERNFPSEPSKMFSPVFTEDWEISGRVYYLTYIRTNDGAYFSDYITITMKFSVHLFNPADNTSVELTSTTTPISVNTTLTQRTFSSEITGTYTIPAGYRLKYDIEYMYDTIPSSYSLLMYTGYPAGGLFGSLTWTITDPTYGNTYTLNNNQRMAGVQLYLRSKEFPDINVFGVTNETVYDSRKNITIDVTPGSISSFRWDGGSWNPFTDTSTTQIPNLHGWHYLEINASDPDFGNTNTTLYKIGFDASVENILLNNAMSSDRLEGGFILNFSVFDVSTVTYEWDSNGTQFPLLSPYDLVTDMFNGWHNLTVETSDFYENKTHFYIFEFDSDNPIISLYNVVNGSIYVPSKNIELKITDSSTFSYLEYSWDSGANQSWTEVPSNIYTTDLPISIGQRTLEVYVEDVFNHTSYSYYEFWVDDTFFNVDLVNLNDGGYYQGGNTVELIVQRSNTTCYFSWNSGPETLRTLVSTSLVLSGGDAMPTSEGLNTLTIRTFNLTDSEHVFNFTFIVDNTAPVISNIQSYNETRNLGSMEFYIYVEDNLITDNTTLIVEYSIDGKIFQSLSYDFIFSLLPYSDGDHTLDLRVRDLAGNIAYQSIVFTIDTTEPDLTIVIPDLVDYSLVDGYMYIPADALVQVTITDDDETTFSYYKIDGGPKIPFTDSIILSISDGSLVLRIYVNDTLDNERMVSYNLIIDSIAPNVDLAEPTNLTKINEYSLLDFDSNDENEATINNVRYFWDAYPPETWSSPPSFDFSINIFSAVYTTGDIATITIEASDILGNLALYNYSFEVDFSPPDGDVYFYNETELQLEDVVPNTTINVQGNTTLWFNKTLDSDIDYISYNWDSGELNTIFDPPYYFSTVPLADGDHNLTITFVDNTWGHSTNNVTHTYIFRVSDIKLNFISPADYKNDDTETFVMAYNDTFVLQVDVLNSSLLPIEDLYYSVIKDTALNLTVKVTNTTSYYEIEVHATNVSFVEDTPVFIQFSRLTGGGTSARLYFRILKKEGNSTILEESDSSVIYGEDLTISLYLEDDLGQNRTVTKLFVNETSYAFDFDSNTSICTFIYSSIPLFSKGNFSLSISIESMFYFANTTSTTAFDIEILPVPILLNVWVHNSTILEGTAVTIYANLTLADGTPISTVRVNFYIFIYWKNDSAESPSLVKLQFTDYNDTFSDFDFTNDQGIASISYVLELNFEHIRISAGFEGNATIDPIAFAVEDIVITFPPPEAGKFPQWLLYLIIGGSIGVAAIISLIIYKVTRPKSFEELMERVTAEDIALNYSIMSPGVILTIFDQRKGPIPLVADHSLDIGQYIGRMRIGVENFLLKIADQAYSSLGFEEHDAGRRVGSIILPAEKMVAFVHGAQLENKMARGGFENLSLIVLADSEFGNLLLNYQEYLYGLVDDLSSALKSKKNLKVVEDFIVDIRKQSVIIMLAAQEMEKSQGGD